MYLWTLPIDLVLQVKERIMFIIYAALSCSLYTPRSRLVSPLHPSLARREILLQTGKGVEPEEESNRKKSRTGRRVEICDTCSAKPEIMLCFNIFLHNVAKEAAFDALAVTFDALATLKDDGIDMSFLGVNLIYLGHSESCKRKRKQ